MGAVEIILLLSQLAEAGFSLATIASKAVALRNKGATEPEIHAWLKNLANSNQADLEKA